jgi:hypothetical protein
MYRVYGLKETFEAHTDVRVIEIMVHTSACSAMLAASLIFDHIIRVMEAREFKHLRLSNTRL